MTELDGIIYNGKIKNLKIKYIKFLEFRYERKEVFFFVNNKADKLKYEVHIIDESNDTTKLIEFKKKISLYYKNKYITKENLFDLNTSAGIFSHKTNNDLIYHLLDL